MADLLRFLRPTAATPRRSRVSFVDGLDADDEQELMAGPNLSGRVERDVVPEEDAERGEFQLRRPDMPADISGPEAPGDLRLPGDLAPAQQRLRPPMSGSNRLSYVEGLPPLEEDEEDLELVAPGQAPIDRDAGDRRTARVQDVLQTTSNTAGRLGQLFRNIGRRDSTPIDFSQSPTGDARWGDPARARIAERHATMDAGIAGKGEAAEAERRIANEDADREMNQDYRRSLMRSMETNADRREFEMERTGERDTRLYDPESAQAGPARDMLRSAITSAPDDVYAAFSRIDVDSLGARDIEQMTDRVLRRIGQVPARDRTVEQNEVLARAAALRGAPEESYPPSEETAPPPPRVGGGPRRAGAAPADQGPPAPAARRDRSLEEMYADILAERDGQPTSTGQRARSFTPRERREIAHGARSSRTRQMANFVGGTGTTGQEAQIAQVQQTGAFTERDIQRASEALAPAASQGRQLAGLQTRAARLSEAEFQVAMRDSALLSRILGNFRTETFMADFRAMTNSELRQQSGAAVTDSEAQRFFAALSARQFTSKAAFIAALARVDAERRANVAALGIRPDVTQAWRERTIANARGGRR